MNEITRLTMTVIFGVRAVTVAILANTGVLLWGLVDHHHERLIESLDDAILWFFAAELAIRFRCAGRRCWRDRWLWFDAAVTAVALAPVGVNLTALRVVRAVRVLHYGRHVGHLRLLALARRLCGAGRGWQPVSPPRGVQYQFSRREP
jgi:Ion transport protein